MKKRDEKKRNERKDTGEESITVESRKKVHEKKKCRDVKLNGRRLLKKKRRESESIFYMNN